MRIFQKFALLAIPALFVSACSSDDKAQIAQQNAEAYKQNASYNLGERELLDILDNQQRLIDYIARTPDMPRGELQTKLSGIDTMWAKYVRSNPTDINALILFGKFQRAMGLNEKAYEIFNRADAMDPNIAVVKQQLATYETEIGEYAKAYANIELACELEPNTSVYHYQRGEFLSIAGPVMLERKILSEDKLGEEMLEAFNSASNTSPKSRNYAIRYAQAFDEIKNPDWNEALDAWDRVLKISPLIHEKNYARKNKGRALLLLKKPREAKEILEKIEQVGSDTELVELLIQANLMIKEQIRETAENKKAFTY